MPNRILRDWTDSDKVNVLSVYAERFFTRLIMKADDYGCFFADTRLLKAHMFPLLLDNIREADLLRWMTECQKAGLIVLYEISGKKYLQIMDFRQRLDKARAKYPLPPDSTDFPEIDIEFPAELETEEESEKEKKNIQAPSAPLATYENLKIEKKKKFVPPLLAEIKAYFTKLVGDPQSPKYWAQDKCENQSNEFLDFYTANGWVQGRQGKPIKDWQAACRLWIRKDLKNDFGKSEMNSTWQPAEAKALVKPPAPPPKNVLPKLAKEINYFYDKFLEDQITIVSLEVVHYDFLKQQGLVSFSNEKAAEIKKAAQDHMVSKAIAPDEKQLLKFMKLFGIMEFFKQMKLQAKETVFDEN
jgi:hypothetical protein